MRVKVCEVLAHRHLSTIESNLRLFHFVAAPPASDAASFLHSAREGTLHTVSEWNAIVRHLTALHTIYTFDIIKRKETGMKLKLVKMCFIVCAAARHILLAAGHEGRFDYRALNVLYIFSPFACAESQVVEG